MTLVDVYKYIQHGNLSTGTVAGCSPGAAQCHGTAKKNLQVMKLRENLALARLCDIT